MDAGIPPDNCCKMLFNDMYNKAMEKQNVPKSCPIKPVSIITHKSVFWLKQRCSLFTSFIFLYLSVYTSVYTVNTKGVHD